MISPRKKLSDSQVGERLRRARENAHLTQAQAASCLGCARTTLVAIEKGQRRIRIDELQKLANFYGTSANDLLMIESVQVDLVPRFRKAHVAEDSGIQHAAALLSSLAKAELELESILGIEHHSDLPSERPLLGGNAAAQAERDAQELRQRIGLGLQPVQDMSSFLELEFGTRVYIRDLDSRIDGLFAYEPSVGACVLLNAKHPPARRNQSAAHELGHIVSSRHSPEVLLHGQKSQAPEEIYATVFGRAFLMPARVMAQRFSELTAGTSKLSRRIVIELAHACGVSREAVVRRLEELELVKAGTWTWFMDNGGITDVQARQVLGERFLEDIHKSQRAKPTTVRLSILATEVLRKGLLSEGQVARLLQVSRFELTELLGEMDDEDDADAVHLPH